jgi:hypothetical protein
MKQGFSPASGMEIGCVVKDTNKWKVDPERTVIEVRCWILQKLAGEGFREAAFVFCQLRLEGGST